jgi:hypothetical protein
MDVGVEFGHYRVVEHIGRGGMADVWSARDQRLGRTVAIKTIVRDLSQDMNPVKLFEREAKTIAALEHPHILPIYEFGDYEAQLYIVMRYVSGGSLEDLVEAGPLPLDEVLRLARSIAQALDYAHTNSVVHLDLKPSNILLDSNESPYLADFGLATALGPEGRAQNPGSGTLLYMAPEQLTADVLDHRADIYSFTVLLFHMLTGQLPFDATTPLALKQLQYQEGLPELDLVSPNLPAALTEVLRMGTALEPSSRPSNLMEMMREFERVIKPNKRMTSELEGISAEVMYDSEADLSDMITQASTGPEAQARREAQDIYTRARRVWAYGAGRFLLGVTHFMLINDYYMAAERNHLEVDAAGVQMLLRGALEYGHEIDYWWNQLDDEGRRWVALHTIRSENAPARVRALERLATLPDADIPVIPKQVAQALKLETNEGALIAAINTLAARARTGQARVHFNVPAKTKRRTTEMVAILTTQLQLRTPSVWQEVVFAPEIDLLLADIALNSPFPAVAELAARTIGRIHSLTAVREIARLQRANVKGALWALALVRDEAPSLPPDVSKQGRMYAWLANTWRRLTDNPLQIVRRFIFAVLGGFFGIGLNSYITYRAEAIFTPSRWGTAVAIGLTCAVLIGFLVLLADELPARLRGFWPWWARFLLSAVLGAAMGIIVWAAYTYLYLEFVPDWNVTIVAGLGLAAGFVAASAFHLTGWAAFLVTTILAWIPLYTAIQQFSPVVYYDYPEQVFVLAIPMCMLIAAGGHAQKLGRDIRRWLGYVPARGIKLNKAANPVGG